MGEVHPRAVSRSSSASFPERRENLSGTMGRGSAPGEEVNDTRDRD